LIAIAEPISRPNHIHEYKLTSTSLYAAASVELKKDDIISILNNFCKNLHVPKQVEEDIERYTNRYGKAKLIL
jgi:DNA excision repair protein ERCC-3